MLPQRRRSFWISLVSFLLVSAGFSWAAADGSLFGPRDVAIGPYGIHVSAHRFEAGAERHGALTVDRRGIGGDLRGGLILLNAQVINLRDFLDENQPAFRRPVTLRQTNLISIFLVGEPGAGLAIEVKAAAAVAPPTVSFKASPARVAAGEIVVVDWDTANAESVFIEPGIGAVAPSGSVSVTPNTTTTYILTAQGHGGTREASATVNVIEPPAVSLSATPASIPKGAECSLSWSVTGAAAVHIEPGIGVVEPTGALSVSPAHTTTYRLTATGPGGTESAETVVQVYVDIAPQPQGSFGHLYQDLVPPDATVETYDARRFALITGMVKSLQGEPLRDVSVTIHGRPQYGTATTDAEGRFNLPVEGRGVLTTVYRKAGYIAAQRQVQTPWNDMAVAETVVMVTEDPAATTIVFNGNPDQVTLHRSTPASDEFGDRSCSVVFSGDNPPYLVDEKGNQIQPLTTITTRATEFTTPESMPAKLPPNSGYTYCVELSVDGAARVKFAKPVVMWVDNFLGFAVGGAVPVGYFDRDRGLWVPADNGRVVRLLDRDGDGVVDALDATGDGQPDDLNANGIFEDEVAGLDNPQHYSPGTSFWRVEVSHFTPWDCNWPFGPPLDAGPPDAEGVPVEDQQQAEEKTCSVEVASFVEERSRIFHEDIPIPGTDISLHYASNRVPGYRHRVSVPASGSTVPPSLMQILVRLEIAGRTFETVLDPLPDRRAEFLWDGRDLLGREVSGSVTAQVSIGFVYPAVYLESGDFSRAFAQAGGSVTGIRARQEVISWRRHDLVIRSAGAIGTIAEGWTLSRHHQMSLSDLNTIHRGDGFFAEQSGRIVSTIVGTGTPGFSGDGGPAAKAMLNSPKHLTVHPSGDLYFADFENMVIRKVDPEGIITTVAGMASCSGEFSGDGGPAVEACLSHPVKVAFDGSGNMYIVENRIGWSAGRIRMVDPKGIITTFAEGLYSSVAVDPSGNLYCSEPYSGRLSKIDPSGTKTAIAESALSDLSLDSAGNLYHTLWCSVFKLDTAGRATKVAGKQILDSHWDCGYSGDGGPANQAGLHGVAQIEIDRAGNLYIAENMNGSVRKVDSRGIITTVAGNGVPAEDVDGKPATQTSLPGVSGVALGRDGSLYVTSSHRILKISQAAGFGVWSFGDDITFAEKNGMGHIFSSAGLHLKTVDLETGRDLYTLAYDVDGRVVSVSDRFGNRTLIERDGGGRAVGIVSPDGLRTALAVDGQNHLTGIRYADGSAYSFEYTADGLLTAKIDPAGNRFEHFFTNSGRLAIASDQEQGYWQFFQSADAAGRVTSTTLTAEGAATTYQDKTESTGAYSSRITDPQGEETLFNSSADALATRKELACGTVLDFVYGADAQYLYRTLKKAAETTPAGLKREVYFEKSYQDTDDDKRPDRITETVSVNGKAGTRFNDTLQARTQISTPLGRTTLLAYDPGNLLVSRISRPALYDTQFAYDARGRLVASITADRQTLFSYDAGGNLASVTEPTGRRSTYEQDAIGRLTAVKRPDGSSVGFDYDANGNMTLLVTPAEVAHEFGFNRVNLQSSYRAPLSGSYQYRYDRDRRPLETLFPSGRVIRHIYERGLLARTTTPEGEIDYSYRCGGKIGTIAARGEGLSFTYDGSLLTSETVSGTLNQALAYSYNNDFQPVEAAYAGAATSYGYDADGLLIQAGDYSIARHTGNGLPLQVAGQGLVINRAFNGYGELAGQSVAVAGRGLAVVNRARDVAGRIARKGETFGGVSAVYDYLYDSNGRLLRVLKDTVPVEEYAYDEAGTRIYEKNTLRGITDRSFVYSDEEHLLRAGEWSYQYDLDGFLTTKTNSTNPTNKTHYFYSSRGELLSVILADGGRIDYVHDPLGRRIAKRIDGAVVEKYLWQGMTRLLAVYSGTNTLLMRFEYADDRLPVAMTAGGVRYYLIYDQVGSLRLVADPSGNVVKSIQYDSFGNILEESNPAFYVPIGFAGGLHDRDTGLVRFGYRDYDPDVGRWTAKDPIGFAGGDTDLYGYVLNNPANYIDSLGLWRSVGHADLTIYAMKETNRFTEAGILSAVAANLSVDRLSNQLNDPAHFMPSAKAAAERLTNVLLYKAITLEDGGFSDEAMVFLGLGLHTIQDRFAHYEQNAGWIKHIGEAACDDPKKRPSEFSRARDASVEYVNQFLRATGR